MQDNRSRAQRYPPTSISISGIFRHGAEVGLEFSLSTVVAGIFRVFGSTDITVSRIEKRESQRLKRGFVVCPPVDGMGVGWKESCGGGGDCRRAEGEEQKRKERRRK